MKIVIEYIGITKEETMQLLQRITEAASVISEEIHEIGMPDSIKIER